MMNSMGLGYVNGCYCQVTVVCLACVRGLETSSSLVSTEGLLTALKCMAFA